MADQTPPRGRYWVRAIAVERRYVGMEPVECVVFTRGGHHAVIVPLTQEQMEHLRTALALRLIELGEERSDDDSTQPAD